MKKFIVIVTALVLFISAAAQIVVSRPSAIINSAEDLDNYKQMAYVVFGDSIKKYSADLNLLASPSPGRIVFAFESYDRGFFRIGGLIPDDVKIGSKNYLIKDLALTYGAFSKPVLIYDLTQKFGEPEILDNGYFWTTKNFSIALKDAVGSTVMVIFNYIQL